MDSGEALEAARYLTTLFLPRVQDDELLTRAVLMLPERFLEAEICEHYPELDAEERSPALLMFAYQVRYELHERAQTRALPLLRRTLPASCTKRLRKLYGHVEITGSAGGRYRIYAYGECVERVFEHNGRWYGAVRYCYHDPFRVLCPADHALAVALYLLADEPGYLAEANPTLWRSSYRGPPKPVEEQAQAVIDEWKERRGDAGLLPA